MGELGKRAALPTPPFLFLKRAMLFITMPILFHVERNNLITQCIMRYRFLVTNREGASGSFEWNHESDADAQNMAASIVHSLTFVRDITVYRMLTLDSCGPIVFIATVDRSDL